jgi:hypothetical protein
MVSRRCFSFLEVKAFVRLVARIVIVELSKLGLDEAFSP